MGAEMLRDVCSICCCLIGLLPAATQAADHPEITPLGNHTSDFDQQIFHYADQGSGFFPISVVEALVDQSTGKPYLENLERFGLVPGVNKAKPESDPRRRFPIGIVTNNVSYSSVGKTRSIEMFGFTCAACHTSEIRFEGKAVRIDGGSGLFDVDAFGDAIGVSLHETFESPKKTREFVARYIDRSSKLPAPIRLMLAAAVRQQSSIGKLLLKQVRRRLTPKIQQFKEKQARRKPGRIKKIAEKLAEKAAERAGLAGILKRVEDTIEDVGYRLHFLKMRKWLRADENRLSAGYGRADDFGTARVELFGDIDHQPLKKNMQPVNAPVSVPPLWNIDRYAWLHWTSNTNSVIQRSVGEAIGVGAPYKRPGDGDSTDDFATEVNVGNQLRIEQQISELRAPAWPSDLLGKPNQEMVDRGQVTYQRLCAECHDTYTETATGLLEFRLFSPADIGTDPLVARNFERPVTLADGSEQEFAKAIELLMASVQDKAIRKLTPSQIQLMSQLEAKRNPIRWRSSMKANDGAVYPARPLEGIWSTAPFLHNGSIPTLHDLLKPVAERPKTFTVGQSDYDPKRLGFEQNIERISNPYDRRFLTFDTSIDGNRNTGHAGPKYGTELTASARYDLLEYLKVHKDPSFPPQ
ncbi:di-heme-cytochrome C peroxidase [bacterium]|nr:di-heme-cytochrome C peroxidase [bacterium]